MAILKPNLFKRESGTEKPNIDRNETFVNEPAPEPVQVKRPKADTKKDILFTLVSRGGGETISEEYRVIGQISGTAEKTMQMTNVSWVDGDNTFDQAFRPMPGVKNYLLIPGFVEGEKLVQMILRAHDKSVPVAAVVSTKKRGDYNAYLMALRRADVIFVNSGVQRSQIEELWAKRHAKAPCKIVVLPIAANFENARITEKWQEVVHSNDQMLLHMMFEADLIPENNHILFLEVLEGIFEQYPELENKLRFTMVGSRSEEAPEIAEAAEAFCEKHRKAELLENIGPKSLHAMYLSSSFCVYPAKGNEDITPVLKSIWYGKPCLCAQDGLVGEIASQGGCCTIDPSDSESLSAGLTKMLTNPKYLRILQAQTVEREFGSDEAFGSFVMEEITKMEAGNRPTYYERISVLAIANDKEQKDKLVAHFVRMAQEEEVYGLVLWITDEKKDETVYFDNLVPVLPLIDQGENGWEVMERFTSTLPVRNIHLFGTPSGNRFVTEMVFIAKKKHLKVIHSFEAFSPLDEENPCGYLDKVDVFTTYSNHVADFYARVGLSKDRFTVIKKEEGMQAEDLCPAWAELYSK